MSSDRVQRIIQHVREHGLPKTPGLQRYLQHEINRMDHWQRTRFYTECAGVLMGGTA